LKCLGGPVPEKWTSLAILKNLPICSALTESPSLAPSNGHAADLEKKLRDQRVLFLSVTIPLVLIVLSGLGYILYVKSRRGPAMDKSLISSQDENRELGRL
jgi:hypothetical protein